MSRPLGGAYGKDLARIHDAGFGGIAREASAFLRTTLQRRGITEGLVVDLGCGSGILARALTDAGYDVLGIDLSPAMLTLARRRAPRARFRLGSLFDAAIPACAAVTAIGECLNYRRGARPSRAALSALFERIHRALVPGGCLLFDVAGPGRVLGRGPAKVHTEGDGWLVTMTAHEDRVRRLLTRRITTFRRTGTLYRRTEEVHRLRLLPREEIEALLREAGFGVRVLRGYDGTPFLPAVTGFLALKAKGKGRAAPRPRRSRPPIGGRRP